jgi:hypothetical protein
MFSIRVAFSACMVFLAYVKMGYYKPWEVRHALRSYFKEGQRLEGEVLTIGGRLPVGTMMCSEDKGWLPADDPFPAEMSELRARYTRIGYYGKFAVWPWLSGLGFGEKLTYLALYWTCERQLDLAVMLVNPSHVRFYKNRFGAEVLSQTNGTIGLDKAPAVLLAIKVTGSEKIQRIWHEELARRTAAA